MTTDELRAMLLSATEENADTANIFDTVLSEFSEREERTNALRNDLSVMTEKYDGLTTKVNELTNTNLKLLDKIKYIGDVEDKKEETDDGEDITIADLFEEEV